MQNIILWIGKLLLKISIAIGQMPWQSSHILLKLCLTHRIINEHFARIFCNLNTPSGFLFIISLLCLLLLTSSSSSQLSFLVWCCCPCKRNVYYTFHHTFALFFNVPHQIYGYSHLSIYFILFYLFIYIMITIIIIIQSFTCMHKVLVQIAQMLYPFPLYNMDFWRPTFPIFDSSQATIPGQCPTSILFCTQDPCHLSSSIQQTTL